MDLSDINQQPVKIKRLEIDLFSIDTNKIFEESAGLQKKYGSFFEKFVTNVINTGGVSDTTYAEAIKHFLADKDMNDVYKRSRQIYTISEIENLEKDLTEAFRRIKYYFPDTAVPDQVLTMISGFNYGIVNVESTMAAGLDYYLGEDAPFYDMIQPQIPAYRKRLMEKDYLLSDMIAGWVIFKFDKNDPEKNLLETMIRAGKFAYCTKSIVPETEDSVIFGYTSEQMDYCDSYERNLWGYFTEKNRLYINDLREIVAYTTDGPFTAAISKECPPAIAKYIGYRIVSAYMENNPQVKLNELMADRDYQKILSKSRYKPENKS